MVYTIYVSGTKFSGKTALCLGLFNNFNELGLKVGYFKPIGQGYKMVNGKFEDSDVHMMKEVIGLSESEEEICPIVLGSRYLETITDSYEESKNKVMNSYKNIKKNKDVLIVEAAQTPETLSGSELDLASLSKKFNAKVIFTIKGDNDTSADKTLLYTDYLSKKGVDIMGIVINFVPIQQVERMRGIVSEVLQNHELNVLGIIPDHRELTLPTVKDIVNVLEAEVLAGKNHLDEIVDNFLVGAMFPDAAMSWLRRSVDRAFITGGDRADLVLMALETKPSVIILTGNIYPSTQVILAAERKGVPLILVREDTYAIIVKLEPSDYKISIPMSPKKIQLTRKIMREYIDWKPILENFADYKNNKNIS